MIFGARRTQKEKGGLGIRKLDLLKRALLGKWVWRFTIEGKETGKNVLKVKYGMKVGGWFTRNKKGCHGDGLWKAINSEAAHLKKNCCFQLGNGEKNFRFWEDKW